MKKITLTAANWKTPKDAHLALQEALGFPEFYGRNLDALHDCLTDLGDVCIVIEECAKAAENMPEQWGKFLMVFLDSCNENPGLDIKLVQGSGDYI